MKIIKKRVCAYARVSTQSELQSHSFATQIETYQKQISSNPEYTYMGVFADHGKSGTSIKQRPQFKKMIELSKQNIIDKIITKSLSRFARNTIDCLTVIKELREHKVEVYFEKENISSFDPNIDFMLSIFSGVAEEESRNISEQVKWGNTKRFENGEFQMVTSNFLGYTRDKDKNIIIDEEQAVIVRSIYDLYLHGKGARKIKDYLESEGFKTVKGNSTWNKSTILDILKNEKYTGDALIQKTYKPSFKSKKRVKNEGQVPKYFVQNSHPAIITRGQFQKVQEILEEKRVRYTKVHERDPKEVYSKKTPYAGLVKCGYCGNSYRVKTRPKYKSNEVTKFLQCSSNENKKVCPGKNIRLDDFDRKLLSKFDRLKANKHKFIKELQNNLVPSHENSIIKNKLNELNRELIKLENKLKNIKVQHSEFQKLLYTELKLKQSHCISEIVTLENIIKTGINIYKNVRLFEDILSLNHINIDKIKTTNLKEVISYIKIDKDNSIKLIF